MEAIYLAKLTVRLLIQMNVGFILHPPSHASLQAHALGLRRLFTLGDPWVNRREE
jgi:hypothetical protein